MTHARIVPCPRNAAMVDVELYFPPTAGSPALWWPYATLRPDDDPAPVLRALCPQGWTFEPPR